MMKTAARSFLPQGAHPLYSHRGLFRINWTAGAINLRKKTPTVIQEIDLTLHSSRKHPRDSTITPLSREHVCVRVNSFMCAVKYLMVQKPAFCICGTFCAQVGLCVCACVSVNHHSE